MAKRMKASSIEVTKTAHRIYMERHEHRWSQAKLAKQIGISPPVISDLERGKRAFFTADTIVNLAKAFNVSADYLLGLSDKKEREL